MRSLTPRSHALFPIVLLIVLLAVLLVGSRSRPPTIDAATPRIGNPGDVLILNGRFFGDARDGGRVTIGGVTPASSAYLEWADDRISVRVPDEVRSGFVYVHTRTGRSNGVLFANREYLPVTVAGPSDPGQPYIDQLDREGAAVGSLLVITGTNFGLQRGQSAVLFTWLGGDPQESDPPAQQFIAANEYDLDYDGWSDTEIRVRVPDGAATGNLFVRTDKGSSNEEFFEVTGRVGTKRVHARRTYSVSYEVSISNINATASNDLYLWVPRIWRGPEQRNIRTVEQYPEPLYADVAGLTVYQLHDLVTGGIYDVARHVIFERFAIETVVNERRVVAYDQTAPLYTAFTAPDALVPSTADPIVARAGALIRGEPNPWRRARIIYQDVRRRLTYTDERSEDALAAFAARSADAHDMALITTALLRAAGIPARPVAGYLVTASLQLVDHYWVEFYVQELGWVPVDPALGSGAPIVQLDPDLDPAEFYFGNLDNRHLALTKGVIQTGNINPAGRTVRRPAAGSLQLHHEEAVGELVSYSARWAGMTMIGVY